MTHRHSVLVIDDNDDIRASIKDILDDLGYETDTAEDGAQALDLLQHRSYDVALVDFKMPGMDGATLYREIRRIRPEIVAIMITAYAGGNGAQEALDAGTWKVLRKPVDFSQLLPMIDHVVHEPMVLLVDDDQEFCTNLWQVLRDQGYRVNIAHTEAQGIKKADMPRVDIAIIDVRLSGGDCRNVFLQVHRNHPAAKTVVITGCRAEVGDIVSGLIENGLDGVHYKPIEIQDLLATLEQFRTGPRLQSNSD